MTATIFDIGRPSETVAVRGENGPVEIKLVGLDFDALVGLVVEFPEIRGPLLGEALAVNPTGERVIEIGREALGAVIAAGLDAAGDARTRMAARKLPLGIQAAFLRAIYRLTMPEGPEVFRQHLLDLGILGMLPQLPDAMDPAMPQTMDGTPAGSSPAAPAAPRASRRASAKPSRKRSKR
jgi:hypothetical protein